MREKLCVQAGPPDSLVSSGCFADNFAEFSELQVEVD
jgi:hypothetical protein